MRIPQLPRGPLAPPPAHYLEIIPPWCPHYGSALQRDRRRLQAGCRLHTCWRPARLAPTARRHPRPAQAGHGGYGLTAAERAIRNRCWVIAGHSRATARHLSSPGTAQPGESYPCSGAATNRLLHHPARAERTPSPTSRRPGRTYRIIWTRLRPLWSRRCRAGQQHPVRCLCDRNYDDITGFITGAQHREASPSRCAVVEGPLPFGDGFARRRSDTPSPREPMDRGAPVRPRGIRRQSLRLLCPQPADAVAAQRSMPRRTRPAAAWTPAAYDRAALPGEPPLHRSLQQPLTLRGVAAAIEDTRPACQMGSSACRGCAAPLGNGRASSGLAP